jgi:hypothetical protein
VSSQQQQRAPAVMLVSSTPAFSVINWDLCYAAYLNEQVFVFTHSPAACSAFVLHLPCLFSCPGWPMHAAMHPRVAAQIQLTICQHSMHIMRRRPPPRPAL